MYYKETGPNNSTVVTVIVFGNLYEEKIQQLYTYISACPLVCPPVFPLVCPPTFPTNSSSYFCLKSDVCHGQKTLTHQVLVLKKNHCDCQPPQPSVQ